MYPMIRIRQILSMRELTSLRVVSGVNGINSVVSSTGFFDCEPGVALSKLAAKGKLMVTTLAAAKDDPTYANACLKTLLHSGVAAIAVKCTFFQDVSDEVKALSDKYNIPLILFNEPGVDDVLYLIRSKIDCMTNEDSDEIISQLLYDSNLDPVNILNLAYRLNPYFRDHIMLCSFITTADGEASALSELHAPHAPRDLQSSTRQDALFAENITSGNLRYTFLPYKRGTFFILTAMEPDGIRPEYGISFLKRCIEDEMAYRQGHSLTPRRLTEMPKMLREALYSNVITVLDDLPVTYYHELRLDRLLCSTSNIEITREVYANLKQRLIGAGDKNNADDFVITLNTYAACNGDVRLTAAKLHQHPNTIRYRIGKIEAAWGCRDILTFDATAKVYDRMEGILRLLGEL